MLPVEREKRHLLLVEEERSSKDSCPWSSALLRKTALQRGLAGEDLGGGGRGGEPWRKGLGGNSLGEVLGEAVFVPK